MYNVVTWAAIMTILNFFGKIEHDCLSRWWQC